MGAQKSRVLSSWLKVRECAEGIGKEQYGWLRSQKLGRESAYLETEEDNILLLEIIVDIVE